jgi:hypothetical protein
MLVGGLFAIAFFLMPRGTLSMVVGLIAVDLFITSLAGWSALYFVLRRSTRSDKDVKPLPRQ